MALNKINAADQLVHALTMGLLVPIQVVMPSVRRVQIYWMPCTENKGDWVIFSPVNSSAWLVEGRASRPSSPWQVIRMYAITIA